MRLTCALLLIVATACDSLIPGSRDAPCGEGIRFRAANDEIVVRIDHHVSEEILLGRRVPISGGRFTYQSTNQWARDTSAALSWCSTNTGVLSVKDGFVNARSPGSATIYLRGPGDLGDSVNISVVQYKYELTFLGSGKLGVAMNDSGDVVGTDGSSGAPSAFLWRGGIVTDLGICRPRDISNRRQVACSRSSFETIGTNTGVWDSGTLTPVVLNDGTVWDVTAINDSGAVSGFGWASGRYVVFVTRGDSSVSYPLTPSSLGISYRVAESHGLNNVGEVVAKTYRNGSSYHDHVAFTLNGHRILPSDGRTSVAVAISDSGVVAGAEPCGIYTPPRPTLWYLSRTGSSVAKVRLSGNCMGWPDIPNDLTGTALSVNNAGHAVGAASGAGYLWRDGRSIALTAVLADPNWIVTRAIAINDRGQILVQAQNVQTNASGAAILRLP